MAKTIRRVFTGNNSGLTLVELILVLTLLLVVLALSLSFFTSMHNSSKMLTQQAQVQENVIIAKTYIDGTFRYATKLAIHSEGEDSPSGWTETIYLDEVDGRGIIFIQKSGGTPSPLLSNLANDFSMQLTFEKAEDSFIVVAIGCVSEDGYEYSVENEQFLLGFGPHDLIGESGDRIYVYGN